METFDLEPNGTVTMITKRAELTPRRRRPIELLTARLESGKKVTALATATRIIVDGDIVEDRSEQKDEAGEPAYLGGDVEVSERQLELIMRLNDVTALGLLVSWTLDLPLPKTEDDFLDLPMPVYSQLRRLSARINADMHNAGDQYGPDGVEDPASPTGD